MAGALACIAFFAYEAIADLPAGTQVDEPKKARFVLEGRQDFLHPILMIQVVRLANGFFGYTDIGPAVGLGRIMAAVFGGLVVFTTVLLARRVVGPWLACGAGVLAAVSPLTVFHAQLFKEDIFVAPWLLLGLAALDRLRERRDIASALAFGLAAGLAASAKYIGIILIPLALALPLLVPGLVSWRRYCGLIALSIGIGLVVFLLINAPLFSNIGIFKSGLEREINHALDGHIIVSHGWYTWLLFHWTTSLWTGLGPALALAGLLGAIAATMRWRATPPALRLTLVFAIAWYCLHEFSPMKPFGAVERHMTVMAGVFAVLGVYFVDLVARRMPAWRHAVATSCIILMAAPAAWSSAVIVRSSNNDTRVSVGRILAQLDGPSDTDWLATMEAAARPSWFFKTIDEIDVAYVLLAESVARRFIAAGSFPGQPNEVMTVSRRYRAMLDLPAIRLTSTAGSFSYRNMPLRIVALRGGAERLRPAVASVERLPQTNIEIVSGRER
jgi:4-amino-4-deoxy-L-arabinose transferase-like glycosyltransferase